MRRLVLIAAGCVALTCAASASALAGLVAPSTGLATGIACAIILGVAVIGGSADPALMYFGPAVLKGDSGRNEVALTFDDGPDPRSTPALLAALEQADARATFYLLADRVEAFPHLARAIAERHEVGVHGLSHHPWLTVYAPERGAEELSRAAGIIERVTGARPTGFRPPFGAVSPRLMAAAERAGLEVVWCSLRTGDGSRMRPEQVRARCLRAVAGDIVLLHEGPRAARVVLADILADLRARGLASVTVAELTA